MVTRTSRPGPGRRHPAPGDRDGREGRHVALVTGGAGGIGEAVTRALVARHVAVGIVDRDAIRTKEVAEELTAAGGRVLALPADVSDPLDVERAVEAAERGLGEIDHLVNAAGVLRLGTAVELDDGEWRDCLEVNAGGVFHVSRAVVRRMIPRRRGAVVTVASNASGTPRVGMAAYAASKAAATIFTKCLGLEVARHGIRCNIVAPGSTDTSMLRSMWHDESGPRGTVEGRPEEYRVGIPLGRIALPTDVANAVLFLLSDQASHITLHDLTVDGGATLGI